MVNRTYIVTGALLLTTVGLLVTLLILTIQWYEDRRELQVLSEEQQQTCVQCGLLSKPDPGKNDNDSCCGTTGAILNNLIKKFSREKYAARNQRRMFGNRTEMVCNFASNTSTRNETAVILLSGLNRKAQKAEDENLIHFRDVPNSSNNNFAEYEKGALRVKKTGFYFISSQIKIEYSANDTHIFRLWINHAYTNGINTTILESSQSNCQPGTGEFILMLGAVFKLRDGDKVYTMTSHPRNLTLADHHYLFRMFIIGS